MSDTSQGAVPYDYISPGLRSIRLDDNFRHMIVADAAVGAGQNLRLGPHTRYCDSRFPGFEFLNRDEAHILYNAGLRYADRPALAIGGLVGWGACHLAASGVVLDLVEPWLAAPIIRNTVLAWLESAGAPHEVRCHETTTSGGIETLGRQGRRWALIFINGDHEFPAPVRHAVACERYATEDAQILLHNLNAPAVAEALYYLRDRGWRTRIYHTAQIMGVAWRGAILPVDHVPDPAANWPVPDHLRDLL